MQVGQGRISVAIAAVAAVLLGATQPAGAISPENMEALRQHFRSLGQVSREIYAPLGGPEVGVAQIGEGTAARVQAVRVVDRGRFETLLSEPLAIEGGAPPFAFLQGGRHLLTYGTNAMFTTEGRQRRGDITIHDLDSEGSARTLFELRGLIDASYQIGISKFQDHLIWQPAPHFLNRGGRLPVKNQYARLLWDDMEGDYKLTQHLTALPDAESVGAANLNNLAIIYYREGRLADAEMLLSRASQLAHASQSLILHNNELVNSEIEDLERQRRVAGEQRYDDALMYYWQGRYRDALRILGQRFRGWGGRHGAPIGPQRITPTDFDVALLCLALAQVERWPEVDQHIAHLAQSPLYADCVAELAKIGRLQNHEPGPDIETPRERYLRLLEQVDPRHQQFAIGIAVELLRTGNAPEARRVLETYLRSAGERDVTEARLMLYELYERDGLPGRDALVSAAKTPPLRSIYGLAQLVDFTDLSAARRRVSMEELDMFKVSGQLEGIHFPDAPTAN